MSDNFDRNIDEMYYGVEDTAPKCRGCEVRDSDKNPVYERHDAYGMSTGNWCEKCYNSSKYPYRKDRYFDPSYAGERMDDDY